MKKFDPFSESEPQRVNPLETKGLDNIADVQEISRSPDFWSSTDDSRTSWSGSIPKRSIDKEEEGVTGNSNNIFWILIGLAATTLATILSWFFIVPL